MKLRWFLLAPLLPLLGNVAHAQKAAAAQPPAYRPPAPTYVTPGKEFQVSFSKSAKTFTGKPCTGHYLYRQIVNKDAKALLDERYKQYKETGGAAQKVLKINKGTKPPILQVYLQGGHLSYTEVRPTGKPNTFSEAYCDLN